MLPSSLIFSNFVLDVVTRDIQAWHGALHLVEDTLHKVSLALPTIDYCMIEITVGKWLDRCI